MRRSVHCLAILAALIAFAPAARAAEPVDLLLVLAADVSRSVDATKFQLQRDGYAAAIANPRVLDAIRSGRNGKIAVAFVEWSGFGNQKVVIDWTAIDGAEGGAGFRRPVARIAAFVRRPHLDQRRHRLCGGAIPARAVCLRAAHHRRLRRRHQQCRPRRRPSARRGAGARHHHQWAGDLERIAAAVEPGAHQSARGPRQLLPQQRHRRARLLRARGQELQLVRRGHHQEIGRRNRRCQAARGSPRSSADGPGHERVTEAEHGWSRRDRWYSPPEFDAKTTGNSSFDGRQRLEAPGY